MCKLLMIAVLTVMVALTAACGGGTAVSGPAGPAGPALTKDDIMMLTEGQLRLGTVIPTGAAIVVCIDAAFNPSTDMWVVACNLYSDKGFLITHRYDVSDKDGKLVRQEQ